MSCFVSVLNGVVVQKQCDAEAGFIEAPDDVCCGMTYDGVSFSNPPLSYTTIEAKVKIKNIRAESLEKFTKNSGISKVYDLNYEAAMLGIGDTTTILRNGKTPYQHLTDFGLKMNKTGAEFAQYIIDENRTITSTAAAVKMTEIEEEYLRLFYVAIDITPVGDLPTLVSDYQSYCDVRTAVIV